MKKVSFKYIGKVLIVFSIMLIFPIIVSCVFKESIMPFLVPLIISLSLGLLLSNIKVENKNIYAKDGFIIVSISWILISIIASIPLMMAQNLFFIDAFFEAVSGITTTGATIFKDVEVLQKSILFWRSFMIFIGGLGVLAFVMAIVPLSKNDKSLHVLKAEMPGPRVSKLVPSIKKTLFYLLSIYIGLSFIEFVLLIIGKVKPFESLLITFGTAGTGGVAFLNSNLMTYSNFVKWIVMIFMFLFGINFNIYFLLLMKDIKSIIKSEELKIYIIIFLVSSLFIILNTYTMFSNFNEAILSGFFHVSSMMTSTGYTIGNITIYPTSCRIIMILLSLVSACAGSTCGGFKIARLMLCLKSIKRDILKTFHPNSVKVIKFEGEKVEEDTLKSNSTFLFLYVFLIIIIMVLISFDGFTISETLNAAISAVANSGVGFELENFAAFSGFSKIVLSIGMLFGRLEIFPLIVLMTTLKRK